MKLEENSRVKLVSFNGTNSSEEECRPTEDYWTLIGLEGVIVQDPEQATIYSSFSSQPRVLVRFDDEINFLELDCHNSVENSLWILESDLEILN